MTITFFVPARGGSKGIKDKNVTLLCGKPLIYWVLNALEKSDYADKITLLKGDASQVLTELTGEYDLVFLDGPKGQYLKQLELILPHVKEGGVILADNVLFRGYVRGDKEPPKRFKTIVKRLKEYLTFVENKELFNTTIYPMGDGMSVSVWKGHNK